MSVDTNDFETAADESLTRPRSQGAGVQFSSEARIHYTYSSAEDLLNNLDDLAEMLEHHLIHQVPRLDILDDYYEGENTRISEGVRRRESHLADHRPPHNYAEYVSQFIQGYMTGIPIRVTYPDDEKVNDLLLDINRQNDADAHNSELILDLSIYGRAYELLFRDKSDRNRFVRLDALQTFVIYDDTVEQKPIAGVRYYKKAFRANVPYTVEVYTDSKKVTYESKSFQARDMKETASEFHHFRGVPVIEYQNNRFRQGDFEKVLPLIDLYDAAQADTANYMTDLNDALLKIVGNVDLPDAKKMKDANILLLQTETDSEGRQGHADADYIYKKYDVGGVEAYKSRIQNDIHMFTNTPNMNDEKFAGNSSGVSMVYKLFGLEQKRVTKERFFKRSLMERYRMLNNVLGAAQEGSFIVEDLDIVFTPNLPKNVKDELEMFSQNGGKLSNRTMLGLLSFVDDPAEEEERIEEEEEAKRIPYDFLADPNEGGKPPKDPTVEGEPNG
ncbi:phage portal protein [Edaphobacillus lindanitolerans]|uniref:Phage portal protein, SPP1 family n=1 Tax=Edaphobacillus lindanitolerans TaxID=550447 RepID=A0A1U7PQN7_9BACI|nr:phage portal protein [Edaphobacillus lindanitolerans]SIT91647.1 phage portal protein, SPP1 family [Edaphobacillus lindanitolerans]